MAEAPEKKDGQSTTEVRPEELQWRLEIATRIAEKEQDSLEGAAKQVNKALAVLRQGEGD